MEYKIGDTVRTRYFWPEKHNGDPDFVMGIVADVFDDEVYHLNIEGVNNYLYRWAVGGGDVFPAGPPKDASVLDIISYRLLAEEGIYVF